MLFLISPAKSLDYDTPPATASHTRPAFVAEATELIEVLRRRSQDEVAELMSLSEKLAALNVERYRAWSPRFSTRNSKQAVLAFDGDVYAGLNAPAMDEAALDWLQAHARILSGLYGVLRPLDLMQPYRLEMGTRLETARGRNLYQFWGERLARHLDRLVATHAAPVLVNLASEEYFKAVDTRVLKHPVVHCVFEDWHQDRHKVIGVHAKRARGLMLRFAAERRAQVVADLDSFSLDGYRLDRGVSTDDRRVFRRRL